jgi:D-glycero-D-manno-heptose 1,7-bisphosphate phosphatase
MNGKKLQKVLFLDRDGVINADSPDYIKSWEEFRFLPGSLQALADLTRAGYDLIVVTNQSIIGRGMVASSVLERIHCRMCQTVELAGGRIHDIMFCPHRPEDHCRCRKPKPEMILEAGRRYDIDLSSTVMIGDRAKDVMCGKKAGCGATILVLTGDADTTRQELEAAGIRADAEAADLASAAKMILSGRIDIV